MKKVKALNKCYKWRYKYRYMKLVYWLEDYGFDYSQIVPALRERGIFVGRYSYVTNQLRRAIFETVRELHEGEF